MNMNGLEVSLDEFKRMKSLDRDILIYKNVCASRQSKFGIYLVYIWLFILTVALGFRKYIPM